MIQTKRNHPAYILKNVYTIIKQILFPLLILFVTNLKSWDLSYLLAGGLILLMLVLFIAYLGWKNYVYSIVNNVLWIEKGVLTKNKKGIALDKITTVNDNQGLLERAFNLMTLKVDTGSVGSAGVKSHEVALLLSKEEAEIFKSSLTHIHEKQSPTQETTFQYTTTIKELLIYALTSNSVFAGLIFLVTVYQMIKDVPVVDKIVEATVKKAFNNTFQTPINEMVFGKAVVVVFILFMIYLVFSFAISIISALIKYYGFTARREQNTLVISYGLLEKKKFTMPVGKIKAVYNRYGFIGQIFGLSALHIESIGYGDERGEIAILYPLLSEKKKLSLMAVLIPEFVFSGIIVCAPKRALSSYLLVNTLLPLIIGIVLTIAVDYGYAFFGLLPLFLLHGFLSYRNNGILMDRKNIVLRKGAFTKEIVVLPTESVQSTTQAQNFLQKRKNLFNLSFTYQSNTRGKQVGIKYMDTSIQHLYDNIR